MGLKIAHLADLQVRWGHRHDEYKQVFESTLEDLRKESPDRIAILGDIFHHKVKLSPMQIALVADFFFDLAQIAPTDIILGNHDLNLRQLEQGDAITPIFHLAKRLGKENQAITVSKENVGDINFWSNSIYFYPDSALYELGNNVVYGVFSCKDNLNIKLDKKDKDPNKTYIALWHGTLYGAMLDNGYTVEDPESAKMSTFDGYDVVMMGDIHEYQSFEREHENSQKFHSIAYCGSLVQQSFGESLDKGYILWNISKDNISHERKIVPNEHGFSSIHISRGEDIYERLDNIQFSANKKKTQVHITYEDYEENYSAERDAQIKKYVKDKYGCEIVKVFWKEIDRKTDEISWDDEDIDPQDFEKMFTLFMDENEFDLDEEEEKEIFDFAMSMEKKIGIEKIHHPTSVYTIEDVEISNILSFPVEPTKIPIVNLSGILGVFGSNFCGKSNTLKAIVWGLFQKIIGNSHPSYITNIYTGKSHGYVKITLDIDGVKYRITREVKKGSKSNSYPTKFEVWRSITDEDGNTELGWSQTLSDNDTAENNEVKNMITDAIGTYDDFMKVSLYSRDERDGYMDLEQQEKNDLIARYLSLYPYRQRYEYAKKPFNEIKAKQKAMGESIEIEAEIVDLKNQIEESEKKQKSIDEEIALNENKKEAHEKNILELTKKLHKIEPLKFSSKEEIEEKIKAGEEAIESSKKEFDEISEWLSKNHRIEIPIDINRGEDAINKDLQEARDVFASEKEKFQSLTSWLEENKEKPIEEINVQQKRLEIDELNKKLANFKNEKQVAQGKVCPTCKREIEAPNPEKEKEIDTLIENTIGLLGGINKKIAEFEQTKNWNQKVKENTTALESLKNSLVSRKKVIDSLKSEFDLLSKHKDSILKNEEIAKKEVKSKELQDYLSKCDAALETLRKDLVAFDDIKFKEQENKQINEQIDEVTEIIKSYKLTIFNLNKNKTDVVSEGRLISEKLKTKEQTLVEIKESDKLYKKYSIFLQAVDRNGIPAMVIRKKLPMINSKVNNVLQSIVDFRVYFEVDTKGNISEYFYNSESKFDGLPLTSASSSQKFIINLAIKDALNYVSRKTIIQPSVIMVDEGFDSLDEELRVSIVSTMQYLASKYKNVIVVTHLNEIKEAADHIIEATKNRELITEDRKSDKKAGVTILAIKK